MVIVILLALIAGCVAVVVFALKTIKEQAKTSDEMEGRIYGLKNCERCGEEFKGQEDKNKDLLISKIVCNDCAKEMEKARNPKQVKKDVDEIRCPKCNSNQISADGKKLSGGRAIAGAAIAGSAGAVLGGLTGKKVRITCLNCGHSWTAGNKK